MMLEPRDRLQKARAEIVDDIARDEAHLAVGPEDRGEDSTLSQHPADVASELFARESVMTIDRRLRSQLAGIDEALRQVRDGRYGICEDCGRAIPQERLDALPQAVRCIECQRREEHRLKNSG